MTIGQRVGKNLARLIADAGLSQKDAAAKIGASQPTVSDLVRGATDAPGIDVVQRICEAFGVSFDALCAEPPPGMTPLEERRARGTLSERVAALERDMNAYKQRLAEVVDELALLTEREGALGQALLKHGAAQGAGPAAAVEPPAPVVAPKPRTTRRKRR